jgi:hypothetical protein
MTLPPDDWTCSPPVEVDAVMHDIEVSPPYTYCTAGYEDTVFDLGASPAGA